MSSINRKLANLITSTGDVASSALDNAASMQVFSSSDSLPTSGLSAGDQALVGTRLYISNGSGWYNVALINATPRLTVSPNGTISLATDGTTPTVITLTAADSDNSDANIVLTAESGGDFFKMATVSQDSSVFTITPRTQDSATALGSDLSSTLTFKASDGISFGSNQVTFTLSFTIANSQYTTLLAKADTAGTDNQVDASTNNHTITEAGNVTSTAFTPYHLGGYSTYFDGTGDYLTGPTPAAMSIGTGNFTIECWFYATSTATNKGVWDTHSSSGSGDGLVLSRHADTTFRVYATSQILISGATAINNAWVHLAVVRDGTDLELFVNGASQGTTTWNVNMNSSTATVIGGGRFSGSNINAVIAGYIRDFRIVKSAVYTSGFTPPTSSLTAITNTSLLACHLPYIADGSTNSHALTVAGNTRTRRFSPYLLESGYTKADHGGAVYFDGTGDYLTVPDGAYKTYGSGNFTIEMWFYADAAFPNNWLLADANAGGTTSTMSVGIFLESPNVKAQVITSAGTRALNGTTSVYQKTWNHIAVTRNGTALTLWINGVASHVLTIGGSETVNDSSNILNVGRCCVDYPYAFNGYISDFRIVKGTAVYTSAFTPPTAPLTAITNTQLLTCTNKNSIWDASGANELITVAGTASASNTQRKFTSSSAIVYDGNSDYLQIPANDFFNFGTVDFTMETFVHAVATGNTYPAFMSTVTGWSSGANGHRFDNTGHANKFSFFVNGFSGRSSGNPFMHTTNTFSHDTWYHYAVTRSGNTFRMFVNGVLEDTQTSTGSLNIGLGGFRSGWSFDGGNGYFNGYIQDMRITRGLARYTSAFTPPTTEFEG